MLKRKVFRQNKCRAVVIPSQICQIFGIEWGDAVDVSTDGKQILITPVSTARQDPQETGAAPIPQGECANE